MIFNPFLATLKKSLFKYSCLREMYSDVLIVEKMSRLSAYDTNLLYKKAIEILFIKVLNRDETFRDILIEEVTCRSAIF